MIDYEAEALAEREAKQRFNALTKFNSTKGQRWIAWCEVLKFDDLRRARAERMHPIAPLKRWSALGVNHDGWTYPHLRTLQSDEVDEMFPGARAALDVQCDDITHKRMVFDQWNTSGGRLRLSVLQTPPETRNSCTTWLPEVGIWRRYCRHVKSKPWRVL